MACKPSLQAFFIWRDTSTNVQEIHRALPTRNNLLTLQANLLGVTSFAN
jgi:hypothetical protein